MVPTEQQRRHIIRLLEEGRELPGELRDLLFPCKNGECELSYAGKMQKEDILAGRDGVEPAALRVVRVFPGKEGSAWKNMIVFSDNLQFLKTVYENTDPLIKDTVKGKVRLIYIDPPFGTGNEYTGSRGQKAYSAKRKGADFVEFMRQRLILAREILADDGVIFVRQGYNFGHYIKIILDEVFGRPRFVNEIVVNRGKQRLGGGGRKYSTATDSVFFYAKSDRYPFSGFTRTRYAGEAKGTNMLMKGERNPPERVFRDPDGNPVTLLPPEGMHWKFVQAKIDEMYANGIVYLARSRKGFGSGIVRVEGDRRIPVDYTPGFWFDEEKTIDSNWTDISGYSQDTGYPTENSEALLHRIITTATEPGDLIMDFFAGSGTTAAVAEKLGRRWIACDMGKLSCYTIQKRLLQIRESRMPGERREYGRDAETFLVCSPAVQIEEGEAAEFCRISPPEVVSELTAAGDTAKLRITSRDSLSAVFIDTDYAGGVPLICRAYFADGAAGGLSIPFAGTGLGERMFVVYIDMHGNYVEEVVPVDVQ
jgi:adenine-specific DNA-methyltransferase